MHALMTPCRPRIAAILFVSCCLAPAGAAFAESPVKLQGGGSIDISSGNPAPFHLSGTASHLGKYTCYGELEFQPGVHPGTQEGNGVAVFEAANGDLLVGVVSCELDARGLGQLAFKWRDSVEFSDGTVVDTTGRFVESRPPGAAAAIQYHLLVVIAIIAILIG
jgi:hypothetical protein